MSRILDRSQYDPRMITNIEIMTAYFVDIFYNHLYFEGKKLKANNNVSSVTDGYKHALNAFIKSLSNPKLYKKAVIGIHQYFMNYTSFTTISFAKCVDRIASNFVPVDYYNSLDNTQKMSILRLVINQAIKNFTKKVVNDHLAKIIDSHQEADNVRLLQDELVDIFLLEREAIYQRFVSSQTQTNMDENVNRLVSEKMQKEIKNLILEKIQLKKENAVLKKIIVKNNAELDQIRENTGTLESTINELREVMGLRSGVDPRGFVPINSGNLSSVLNKVVHVVPEKKGGLVPDGHAPTSMESEFVSSVSIEEVSDEDEGGGQGETIDLGNFSDMEEKFVSKIPDDVSKPEGVMEVTQEKGRVRGKFAKKPPVKSVDKLEKKGKNEIPKKKKPSSEMGDGVDLSAFY